MNLNSRLSKWYLPFLSLSVFLVFFSLAGSDHFSTWEVYGGSSERIHYSSLKQIDTVNVKNLRVAWVYHTGDTSQTEVNPIIIGHTLYGVSPKLKLFALDAATGKQQWVFDPYAGSITNNKAINACRGIAYFKGGENDPPRIFYTAGTLLYCINANDGRIITSFGNKGTINLREGLDRDIKNIYITSTTPGVIYKDLLILGTRVAEEAGGAPGHIRAYDVHTGARRWIFHTIPFPGEAGYTSWEDKESYKHAGGVNAWAGFSLDTTRGMIFAQIGSATYDFYGGKRKGNNLYANCVLALDAATGKRIWHYQTVHHDVWDRDPPMAPVLVTVIKDHKKVDAVVQLTKSGLIFLLDRVTGKPLYPVMEKPVPAISELEGEQLSRTQPFPTFFKPFARQTFTLSDLNHVVSDSSYQDIRKRYLSYKKGWFMPPSKEGTLLFPGMDGGAEWGGPAYDPQSGLLYVNANEMPWVITMVSLEGDAKVSGQTNYQAGAMLYRANCMGCHGQNREGGGNYPSLIGVRRKYTESAFLQLINSGRRMMPAFKQLSTKEKNAIASFILDLKEKGKQPYGVDRKPQDYYVKMPYSATGYNKFRTKEGYPAINPPWGTLSAINLNTGKLAWRDTLGDYPELKARGIHAGTENYGGPVVTAGGVLIIAATKDAKIRAFNKRTGQLLWEADLPAAGFATPSVYQADGRQYIVIACGGGKLSGAPNGDAYVAFALPGK